MSQQALLWQPPTRSTSKSVNWEIEGDLKWGLKAKKPSPWITGLDYMFTKLQLFASENKSHEFNPREKVSKT